MINNTLQFDKFTKGFLFDECSILYHPLTHSTIIGKKDLYECWKNNSINKLDENITSKLINENLAYTSSSDCVSSKINNIVEKWKNNPPNIKQVYLILNNKCNFRCKYCRQTIRESHANNEMSKDTAFLYIDELNNSNSLNKKGIIFYGGEPMLSKDLIIQCVCYVRNTLNNKNMEMTIITNGTNIDDKTAKFFANNNVYIIISLDGQSKENDFMRVDCDGNGTFINIINGLNIYKNNNCKVGISCTLGRHNVLNIKETLSFFKKLDVLNLGMNLPHDDQHNPIRPDNTDDWLQHTLNELWDATQSGIYIEHIVRKLRLYVTQCIRISECPSAGGRIVVLPDARIGVCEGAIGNDEFFNNPNDKTWFLQEIDRWKNSIPLLNTDCSDCVALGICGGGCPLDGYFENKVLSAKGSVRCEFYKKLIVKILQTVLNNNISKIETNEYHFITQKDRNSLYSSMVNNDTSKPLEISAIYGEVNINNT